MGEEAMCVMRTNPHPAANFILLVPAPFPSVQFIYYLRLVLHFLSSAK